MDRTAEKSQEILARFLTAGSIDLSDALTEPQEIIVRSLNSEYDIHTTAVIGEFAILCERKHFYEDLAQVLLADLRTGASIKNRPPKTDALRSLYDERVIPRSPNDWFDPHQKRTLFNNWAKAFRSDLATGDEKETLLAELLSNPGAWERPIVAKRSLNKDSDIWDSIKCWAMVPSTSQPLQKLTVEICAQIRRVIASEREDLEHLSARFDDSLTRQSHKRIGSATPEGVDPKRDCWPENPEAVLADSIYASYAEELLSSLAELGICEYVRIELFAPEKTMTYVPAYFTKTGGRDAERFHGYLIPNPISGLTRSGGEWVISRIRAEMYEFAVTRLAPFLEVISPQIGIRIPLREIQRLIHLCTDPLQLRENVQELREVAEVLNLRQQGFAKMARQGRPIALIHAREEIRSHVIDAKCVDARNDSLRLATGPLQDVVTLSSGSARKPGPADQWQCGLYEGDKPHGEGKRLQFIGTSLNGNNLALQNGQFLFGTLKEAMREFEAEGYLSLDGKGQDPWELHMATMAEQSHNIGLFRAQPITSCKSSRSRTFVDSAEGIVAGRLLRRSERVEEIFLRRVTLGKFGDSLHRRELHCKTLGLGRHGFDLSKILDKALRSSTRIALNSPLEMSRSSLTLTSISDAMRLESIRCAEGRRRRSTARSSDDKGDGEPSWPLRLPLFDRTITRGCYEPDHSLNRAFFAASIEPAPLPIICQMQGAMPTGQVMLHPAGMVFMPQTVSVMIVPMPIMFRG